MQIKNDNVATYGLKTWEQTGTIAIDFANYLENLHNIDGIQLNELLEQGWYQVGFRFGKSLIDKSETMHLDIVLSRQVGENTEFGYVSREVDKTDFLKLVVNFTAYISNQVHFSNDDITFRELINLEV